MSTAQTQLTLRLAPQDIFRFDNFLFCKPELEQALSRFCQLDDLPFLYLAGPQGTGKTHLLLACTEQVQKAGLRSMYLSLADLKQTASADIFMALEQVDLLCLDDLDAIVGDKEWEEALFHCFNRVQEAGCRLLVSASDVASQLSFKLPDIQSRLATGVSYQLAEMTDEQKQQALVVQIQARGLSMADGVAAFLLRHYGRDMPSLMNALLALDKASLQAQRKLTIPFVKQVLDGGE